MDNCEHLAFDKYFMHDELLFKNRILFMPKCSLRESLVSEAYMCLKIGLMRYFKGS